MSSAAEYDGSAPVPTTGRMAELDAIADLLDTKWRIPGTGIRFGVDALAGLIPGAGDAATGLVSAYIIYKGARLGASSGVIGRMVANTAIDTVVGSVPVLGSVFDLFFKANRRNMRLLRRHLEGQDSRRLRNR
ncbi:DUF4112 domain-containing protein [Oricola cellulosilytica]|uniref:DUF4112 domain-containing protein n=1 Tax=Oricola cellulosilytica TaxID=1429082 RepID=A0A4R0PF07_9HYPH|nr:DUF4112 domain-containing protein [Oricola cellulosilytica]TCD16405.1 DUF4112 domain-containing protein [Oricola cellulosilytica]